jgi:predicted small lipoprotein YifL
MLHHRTKIFASLLCAVMLLSLCACGQSSTTEASTAETEEATTSETTDPKSYSLTEDASYQGVSFKVDSNWSIKDHGYDCNVTFDTSTNSNISVQTALYGQCETLAGAWHEFTNAEDDPVETDSWSADGIEYHVGTYSDKYYLITGDELSTGKGFLAYAVFADAWSADEASKLFEEVRSTLTYDPSQTTIDKKVEYTGKSHESLVREGKSSNGEAYSAANGGASSSGGSATSSATYGEGAYKVGSDMPAGEYRLTATSSMGGYWKVTESSAPDADIVGNDNFSGSTYVTVSEGQYLTLNGCKAEPAE